MNGNRFKISYFSIILIFVCLAIVGVAFIPRLPFKLTPSKTLSGIRVSFSMYGNSPRIIEMEVTSRLEAMLNRMKGVRNISSTSYNDGGVIDIEFDKKTDIEMARFEVSTIIRQVWPLLPPGVSYPRISVNRSRSKIFTVRFWKPYMSAVRFRPNTKRRAKPNTNASSTPKRQLQDLEAMRRYGAKF